MHFRCPQQRKARLAELDQAYQRDDVEGARAGKADEALASLTLSVDLATAVADADLVIEAVPEVLQIKRDLYTKLAKLAPGKTIFATNSSTLLPSDLKDVAASPDAKSQKFAALLKSEYIDKGKPGVATGEGSYL